MELIRTTEHNGNPSVSARDLHLFLEVGRDFSNWIKGRITEYGFIENQDFEVFLNFEKNSKGGRPTKEYILSMDMAKELSMIERSEKGKQARLYFIECEKRLRKQNNQLTMISQAEITITKRRKVLHKEFITEAKNYLFRGDLKELSQENKIPYNKIRSVVACVVYDKNIINLLYEKAMNNKYSLEAEMNEMLTNLQT